MQNLVEIPKTIGSIPSYWKNYQF